MPKGKYYDLDTDNTLSDNSDIQISSQKATKTYIDNNYVPNSVLEEINLEEAATVAKTGDYNDLVNKPTIPAVNDAVLTIQQNGTTMATFSANASTNTTLDMSTTIVKFRDWSDD